MGPTVGEALAEFRRVNGLADDEAMHSSWMCRIGPIGVRVPNFEWRRQAILAHDLHHVLTGLPCGMRGEFQMAEPLAKLQWCDEFSTGMIGKRGVRGVLG